MRKSLKFKSIYLVVLLSLLFSVLPVAGGSVALAGAGDLVPIGDQLGDVGQYYSQVSPNMNSRTYVYNTSSSSRTVKVALYSDTGSLVSPLASPNNDATLVCSVAANRSMRLLMNENITGTLAVDVGTGTGCTNKTGLYGLYHMKIWQTESGDDLAVSVNTWTTTDARQVTGAYQAVPSSTVSSEYVLPNVKLDRTTGWDTEIVMQNVSGVTTTVTFEVSPDSGGWFNNNLATLKPNERRIFLASQLLYAPATGGTLAEKDGWAWVKLRAFHATNSTPQNVAVTVNIFKQGLTDGKYRAELGSERMMSFEAPVAGTDLFVPGFVVNSTSSAFRVANASTWTANITARLYDQNGSQVGSAYTDSVNNQTAKYFASNVFGASSGTYTLRISSSQNVTAAAWHSSGGGHTGVTAQRVEDTNGTATYLPFYWENFYSWGDVLQFTKTSSGSSTFTGHVCVRSTGSCGEDYSWTDVAQYAYRNINLSGWSNELAVKASGSYPLAIGRFENYSDSHDRVISYNGIAKTSGTWYVPFAPSPVVPFEWDNTTTTGEPSGAFGIAFTSSGKRGDSTLDSNGWGWANRLNYYFWHQDGSHCAEGTRQYYIPMYSGFDRLRDDDENPNNNTYNTSTRMASIRNDIASRCAGRPLLGLNEPDYTDQDNATYPEQARSIFVTRNWPGEMYSPAFGDYYWATGNIWNPDGYSYPWATSFSGLKNYYEDNDTDNANRPSWGQQLDYPIDGIALHFYPNSLEDLESGNYKDTTISAYLGTTTATPRATEICRFW